MTTDTGKTIRTGAFRFGWRPQRLATGLLLGALALSACAPAPTATGINDPYEAQNRQTHALNKRLDRAVVRPSANVYGNAIPAPITKGISNFAANMGLPGTVLNDLLQVNISSAMNNTFRFFLNSTIGVAGLFDPANALGLYEEPTDFGETLHNWGVGEGTYQELPLAGPSTQRDTTGMVVDFIIDPMNWYLPANIRYLSTASKVLSRVGDRNTFGDTVDSLLYESEDSYAQARILYLQNRRYNLGGGLSDSDYEDPYAN